jgi:hypothetical protein
LRFGAVLLGLARQQRVLGEGNQVGDDQRELRPDRVDVLLPGREVSRPVSLLVRIRSLSAYDLMCRSAYHLMCRSVLGESSPLSP